MHIIVDNINIYHRINLGADMTT